MNDEKKEEPKQVGLMILSCVVVVILIANIILAALGRISIRLFWMVIIVGAILAYYGIPYLRKK